MTATDAAEPSRPIRSDLFRANVSALAALATSAVAVVLAFLLTDAPPAEWTIPLSILIFLVYWLSFATFYLWWTHRVYSTADVPAVREVAVRDRKTRRTWAGRISGLTGPTDWTTAAAMMAVVVTVGIALSPGARENPVIILLGLSTVASSWALMVYSFALDYMQVTVLQEPTETPHIAFGFSDEPTFSDYLSFSVMVSAMAFAAPAEVTSRRMWRKLRSHVLLAFIFNTVIVAMMVSLLFGGLTGG
ncbi:DUF1345 domain-containing protein [Corynebacterium sp. USCH3]|uniref:DUF1345 domain-containing protein n=1 Tax=Corynebacterium sp. USCH3 TaxID=3024840 RepID=UPI00309E8DF8